MMVWLALAGIFFCSEEPEMGFVFLAIWFINRDDDD